MKRTCKPGHKTRLKVWAKKVKKICDLIKKLNLTEPTKERQ